VGAATAPVAVPDVPRGEVDGFLSLRQIDTYFAELHTVLPAVVTPALALGTTARGRNVTAYCLGACDGVDEGRVPKAGLLLTGMHHSREVLSVTVMSTAVVVQRHVFVCPALAWRCLLFERL
jgi:hypothetical protein